MTERRCHVIASPVVSRKRLSGWRRLCRAARGENVSGALRKASVTPSDYPPSTKTHPHFPCRRIHPSSHAQTYRYHLPSPFAVRAVTPRLSIRRPNTAHLHIPYPAPSLPSGPAALDCVYRRDTPGMQGGGQTRSTCSVLSWRSIPTSSYSRTRWRIVAVAYYPGHSYPASASQYCLLQPGSPPPLARLVHPGLYNPGCTDMQPCVVRWVAARSSGR
ncbi:hypothetical protein C8F01DRAFT_99148 [Mycena amicta]|nr:hypothetical protein C8F01DRAFT_99148 [Mycena amicta]